MQENYLLWYFGAILVIFFAARTLHWLLKSWAKLRFGKLPEKERPLLGSSIEAIGYPLQLTKSGIYNWVHEGPRGLWQLSLQLHPRAREICWYTMTFSSSESAYLSFSEEKGVFNEP